MTIWEFILALCDAAKGFYVSHSVPVYIEVEGKVYHIEDIGQPEEAWFNEIHLRAGKKVIRHQ